MTALTIAATTHSPACDEKSPGYRIGVLARCTAGGLTHPNGRGPKVPRLDELPAACAAHDPRIHQRSHPLPPPLVEIAITALSRGGLRHPKERPMSSTKAT